MITYRSAAEPACRHQLSGLEQTRKKQTWTLSLFRSDCLSGRLTRVLNVAPQLVAWDGPLGFCSSAIPFSSCHQSFPASGSFQMNQLFASGGQSIGVSASISVLPMNIQDWFPLGWTGWISTQFKGLSRVFSSHTIKKHQFFGAQLSL